MTEATAPEVDLLAPYRRALPEREFEALGAWVSTFWPFQKNWLLDAAAMALCLKSRQIGMSHTTSGTGVLWGAFHGELTTFISVGEVESREVLDKAKKHAGVLVALGSRMARPVGENATEIRFASGGRIMALPSSGGRGFTGNVFLDEYAYQQHAKQVWDAAAAVTLLGGKLRVASTPNGLGNEFHNLCSDPDATRGWSRHEIPISLAIAAGYPVDIAKCWALAKGDKRLFDQLFNCKFLDGELQYIPSEAVKDCSVEKLDGVQGDVFGGLDIGRTSDRTELILVRRDKPGVRWQQLRKTCKRTDSKDIFELAQLAFGPQWNCKKLCVDSTGMGVFPAEQLQKKFGERRVEPVSFTLQSKEELATGLYSAFVEHTVRIDKKDEVLRDDVCSVRRIVSEAGNIKYDAPHTDKGHADSAWALALALKASGGVVYTYGHMVQ